MTGPAQQSMANYVGVDLSGATLRAALVSRENRVLDQREAPLEREAVAKQIGGIIAEFRDTHSSIAALGIGIPGLVNPRTNRVIISADLPSLVRSNFHDDLIKTTGLPAIELENDANAAAYGEYHAGSGRGSRDMFYVTIGNGIGGALILGGKVWFGVSGFAGEFGHTTIDPDGIECACGNRGCLETVASAPNIVRRTHERLNRDSTSSLSRLAMTRDFTAADIAREARNGDDFALMMIERTGRFIGTAVASVINLLNIERIVFGGGVMEAGDLILNPIIREAGRRSFQPCFEATQIVAATLGNMAVPIGAALLARDTGLEKNASP